MNATRTRALATRFDALLLDPGVQDDPEGAHGAAGDPRALGATAGPAGGVAVVVVDSAGSDPASLRGALARLGVAPDRALLVSRRRAVRDVARAVGVQYVAADRGLDDALTRAVRRSTGAFARAAARVTPLDDVAMRHAEEHHTRLTKPTGSLGRLETVGALLAGITEACPPPIPTCPAVAVFAADHGVVGSGVTPWPQDVTAQMVRNFVAGGAAVNAIARQTGAFLRVVDVGVAAELAGIPEIDHRKVRHATEDLSAGPAMTSDDAFDALDAGAEVADALVRDGHDLLVTGEMGIGNTTPSAALIGVLSGLEAPRVTGRGTGIDDTMLRHKTRVVQQAMARAAAHQDPISVLSEVGGLEIAALAGYIVGGVALGVPVIADGVITLAALMVADALVPGVAAACIAGHRSTEPAAGVALARLGLQPLLDLDLRLGEGTGGCLAIPIVQAAARLMHDMATFDDAAVTAT